MSPEDRTTETCGRFSEGVRWWSSHFCRVEYKLYWGFFSNDSNWIAGFELANFIISEKVFRMNPRGDRCIGWYFFCKIFFEFWDSWCQVLHRSCRSFLCVGCGLEIGIYRIVCFRSGWSHNAHRGRTMKLWVLNAGWWEGRWNRFRV